MGNICVVEGCSITGDAGLVGWFLCVSPGGVDVIRRDGFGGLVVGRWDGYYWRFVTRVRELLGKGGVPHPHRLAELPVRSMSSRPSYSSTY